MQRITLSTVTPVYSGAAYLNTLIQEVNTLKIRIESSEAPLVLIESIFVVDGCIDNSLEILQQAAAVHPWIRIIELSKNFGQLAATAAGFLHTSGDWIVSLDEDMQHPPKETVQLLRKAIEQTEDICYGNPYSIHVHGSLFRDLTSRGIKWLLALATNNPNVLKFSSFRMVRGDLGRAAASICRNESYFDVVLGWFTNRVAMVKIDMSDYRFKQHQKSGYSIMKLLSHGKKMVMTSKIKLLRMGIFIGFFTCMISLLLSLLLVTIKVLYPDSISLLGWTSTTLAILFFGGLNAFLSGLNLESTSDMVSNVNGKPSFFIVDRSKDGLLKDTIASV